MHAEISPFNEGLGAALTLDLVEKEAIVEYIARKALARIISRDALWRHFGNTTVLRDFWALSPPERRKIWGDPIDPMVSVKEFDPKYLHNGLLGKV